MDALPLSDQEFQLFQRFVYDTAGIHLNASKKALVSGRLLKRVKHHHLTSFGDYFKLLQNHDAAQERQTAMDLLTTNETYFFRESKHFDFLSNTVLAAHPKGRLFRVWSAACSSGEEPYTLAMVLHDRLGDGPWEVIGSDISTQVLERARRAHYPLERGRDIPQRFLEKYCLKGVGAQAGTFMVDKTLRARVQFMHINLKAPPKLGEFDVIFLRNVMIYFDVPMKQMVVTRLAAALKSGGRLIIGHSESLNGVSDALINDAPTIYRRR